MTKEKTTVKISENDLATLIENITEQVVAEEKKIWIAEQATQDKTAILEGRIAMLEKLISKK